MDEQKINPIHGGNIYRLAEELNTDEREIIDFSASINPLGVPKGVLSAIKETGKHLFNYPDPDAKALTQTIAQHIGVNPQSIMCGNGSTELIYLVVRALKPEKVLIPAPTFSEYERAVGDPKKVEYFILWEKNKFDLNIDKFIAAMSGSSSSATYKSSLTTSVDVAFLCNPNNPTGRLLTKEEVMEIAAAAQRLKCWLVVDEAFIDFVPEHSVVKEVENNPYLIVLRSMTKFYALSGLRIGYCVVPMTIEEIIKKYKEPWTVNTLAQAAGIAALSDNAYAVETFKLIKNEKKTLEDGLKILGITYFPSSANFYLAKHDNVRRITAKLRQNGIMIRDCSNFMGLDETFMRIAVKSNKQNMRLIKEIANL
ncbi:MAG: threonine-phosphate decarboxylase [Nitrospirae bacterium GWB2_47_37]|nr:MAG: threonine-phosphate decarboxylase [Nitrospirae bacterium GWA2_46_11]OGW25843.1 MAG: threonine-phosphate decarboxylase [Nitrospirae bacterium GWB2_47_37]